MTEATDKPKKLISAPELPPEQCQHIRILDVNQTVQRVFYECWHCKKGLITECTGKPIFEEIKGRQSVQEIKIQCPNCERTAIKLITEKIRIRSISRGSPEELEGVTCFLKYKF